MRKRAKSPNRFPTRSSPRIIRSSSLLLRPYEHQYSNIENALQTLDNNHALILLQTLTILPPNLSCFRTKLAHQLGQHHLCLSYSRNSLLSKPACQNCLCIFIEHAKDSKEDFTNVRNAVIAAISEQNTPQLLHFTLQLAELAGGSAMYQRMLGDLRALGAQLDKLKVLQISVNNRKIVSKSFIQRDEQILFIPKNRLITLELARTLPLVQKLNSQRVSFKSPKHTQLAIYLLFQFQQGEKSPFSSYLQTLPTQFSHFPINYSQILMNELTGTCFLEQVHIKKQDLRKDYDSILAVDSTFSEYSFERFVQARLLVSSRVFGIIVDHNKTDALVPLADMLNHHLPKQTSWYYCDVLKGFSIQSLKEIPLGAEIFDSYGQKCNSRFLLNYGFTLPNNPHNEITIQLNLPSFVTNKHQPSHVKIRVNRILQSKSFEEMMGVLRAAAVEKAQLTNEDQEQIINSIESIKQTPFKSIETQIRAWKILQTYIGERLKEYSTTLAKDKQILEKGVTDSNLMNVITLRKGEKEVYTYFQVMARRVGKFLSSGSRRGQMRLYEPYIASLQLQGRDQ